jgi:hypothetical protein
MCPILALSAVVFSLLAGPHLFSWRWGPTPSAGRVAHARSAAAEGAFLPSQQPSSQPPVIDRSTVPFCPVSEDPKYGFTQEQPVQVGGGSMYGPARERRYLDALRGPAGQPVQYKRTGSTAQSVNGTILDAYEVTYERLEKPATLYLDEYHFGDLRAPQGFTCGRALGLGLPPADPFQTADAIVSVALEQGAGRDFTPIPLDQDGATTHGVVFDRFRMIARAARAASAAGTRLDPKTVRLELTGARTVVLAYPLSCNDKTAAPAAIEIIGPQGTPMRRDGEYARDAALGVLLPGVQAPASSLAATFPLSTLRPTDTVRITYADAACTAGSPNVSLPVKYSPPRMIDSPLPPLPAGATPDAAVRLQALVDLDGTLQRATYLGGPASLSQAAIDAAGRWRSEPPRVNGAPIATGVVVQVKFKE